MKYTITILAILALTSCKKDYTCQCVDKDGYEISTNNYKSTKGDLDAYKTQCTGQAGGFVAQYPDKAPITCTLK